MSERTKHGTICKSPPVQRRYCVYFHERTGLCTMTSESVWQASGVEGGSDAPSDDTRRPEETGHQDP